MTHEQKMDILRAATHLADTAGRLESKIVFNDLVKDLIEKSKELLKSVK